MLEAQTLLWVFIIGALLGAGFFGGLWWTVRRGFLSSHPALWFFGSLILRMAVTMYGFYVLGGTDWRRWLACLAGFLTARILVHRLTREIPAVEQEAGHAS